MKHRLQQANKIDIMKGAEAVVQAAFCCDEALGKKRKLDHIEVSFSKRQSLAHAVADKPLLARWLFGSGDNTYFSLR